jgi:two-component system invasion response regulator UvrY
MIRIALADDHHQVRETWYYVLSTNKDFEVVAKCRNGEEAIYAASAYSPDIFLVDINMEPVNGIAATEIITRQCPGVKVIGMSIHLDSIYVKRMLDAGARGYVTKNSSYHEVFDAIIKVHAGEQYLCTEVRKEMPVHLPY